MGSNFLGLVDMGLLGSPTGLLGLPSLISHFILFRMHDKKLQDHEDVGNETRSEADVGKIASFIDSSRERKRT